MTVVTLLTISTGVWAVDRQHRVVFPLIVFFIFIRVLFLNCLQRAPFVNQTTLTAPNKRLFFLISLPPRLEVGRYAAVGVNFAVGYFYGTWLLRLDFFRK